VVMDRRLGVQCGSWSPAVLSFSNGPEVAGGGRQRRRTGGGE
jgi:hypothetical protein